VTAISDAAAQAGVVPQEGDVSSYCSVFIVGRAGGNPEERQSGGGKRWCTFRIAVNRLEGANRQPVADWFSVVAFESAAEGALRSVQKGDLVLVDGRLQSRQYEGADGKPQQRVEVVANRVRLLQRNAPRNEVAPAVHDESAVRPLVAVPSIAWELEPAIPF
jgi:single-strand DNA-binding protein